MKTITVLVMIMSFSFLLTAQENSEKSCAIELCFSKCVNNAPICGIWNQKYYIEIFNQVLERNRARFDDLDRLMVGDTVIFPPFEAWGRPINLYNLMIVEKNESIWKMVHRYLSENFLFCLDEKNQEIVHQFYRFSSSQGYGVETKNIIYGNTVIIR